MMTLCPICFPSELIHPYPLPTTGLQSSPLEGCQERQASLGGRGVNPFLNPLHRRLVLPVDPEPKNAGCAMALFNSLGTPLPNQLSGFHSLCPSQSCKLPLFSPPGATPQYAICRVRNRCRVRSTGNEEPLLLLGFQTLPGLT